jgi:hypothetical protein
MRRIRQSIKKFIHSRYCPDLLFDLYFEPRAAAALQKVLKSINSRDDLMGVLSDTERSHWTDRISNVLQGPDNAAIPRHREAGTLRGEQLVMHNGLLIHPLSYYSLPMLKMLIDNRGVHEPQEEKIFQEVLHAMSPGSTPCMLELGAYWSFYSMWFLQQFPKARCIMVEPLRKNLFFGKKNFKLNGMKGRFLQAGIGDKPDRANNITTVDTICEKYGIDFIDILHSDIQGFELDMLHGSSRMLTERRVGYLFVSTHSNELHRLCRELLEDRYGFITVASADLDETYSWDGILAMRAPDYAGLKRVSISKKSTKQI